MKKPVPPVCPPIPPEIQEMAAEAEQRKDAALDRLQKLAEQAPPHQPDEFERALHGLVERDQTGT